MRLGLTAFATRHGFDVEFGQKLTSVRSATRSILTDRRLSDRDAKRYEDLTRRWEQLVGAKHAFESQTNYAKKPTTTGWPNYRR